MKQNPFSGAWRIVWMSGWDQDYVDMEVPGHISFGAGWSGSFQCGLVQAQMDCRIDRQPTSRIKFTWHGFDEGDEVTGCGHAEIVDGELQGHLYIHLATIPHSAPPGKLLYRRSPHASARRRKSMLTQQP